MALKARVGVVVAGCALAVARPARADGPARVHAFAEITMAFGPIAGKMTYKGPIFTGVARETVDGEKTQSFEGLSFDPALALGVRIDSWVFGARAIGTDVRGFARAPHMYQFDMDALAAGSLDAFARWYFMRPYGGPWLEASAGALNTDIYTRSMDAFGFPPSGPSDGDAFTSLWGPDASVAFGDAIDAGPAIEWGPVLRLSGATVWSAHGSVLLGGATVGVMVALR